MTSAYLAFCTPVSEIPTDEADDTDEAPSVPCGNCPAVLTDEAYHIPECGDYYCEPCVRQYCREAEARTFALRECRITWPLPEFDDEHQYRPTPDEYELGMKEANTPNAHSARCRHEHTNYAALLKANADRETLRGRIYYEQINRRTCELVGDEWDCEGLEE